MLGYQVIQYMELFLSTTSNPGKGKIELTPMSTLVNKSTENQNGVLHTLRAVADLLFQCQHSGQLLLQVKENRSITIRYSLY